MTPKERLAFLRWVVREAAGLEGLYTGDDDAHGAHKHNVKYARKALREIAADYKTQIPPKKGAKR